MQHLSIGPLRRLLRQSAAKGGLHQGDIVFTGEPRDAPVRISAFVYDADTLDEQDDVALDEACGLLLTPGTTWLNVDGVHDAAVVHHQDLIGVDGL